MAKINISHNNFYGHSVAATEDYTDLIPTTGFQFINKTKAIQSHYHTLPDGGTFGSGGTDGGSAGGISSSSNTENDSIVFTANATSIIFGSSGSSGSSIRNHSATIISATIEELEVQEQIDDSLLDWSELLLVCLLCVLIVITVIGNTLVILSVLTTRRLRTVTNCFVMSLAVADWLVGIFVMPPAVAVHLIGKLLMLLKVNLHYEKV